MTDVTGTRAAEEIDRLIDEWHNSHDARPLHEYLGWTREQYKAWVEVQPTESALDKRLKGELQDGSRIEEGQVYPDASSNRVERPESIRTPKPGRMPAPPTRPCPRCGLQHTCVPDEYAIPNHAATRKAVREGIQTFHEAMSLGYNRVTALRKAIELTARMAYEQGRKDST